MLDLSKSPLLRNVPKLNGELQDWQQNSSKMAGRDNLAKAINRDDFRPELFDDDQSTHYALMAYQNRQITLAQFSSVALLWSAFADYRGKLLNPRFHRVDAADPVTRALLRSHLQLENLPELNIDTSITPQTMQAIINEVCSENTPSSERYFMTFDLEDRADLAEILTEIKNLGFSLLMPRYYGKGCRVIVPSFSLLQAVVNHVTQGKIQLESRVGDDTYEDVRLYHRNKKHPCGLSILGYEHDFADGRKAKRLGFALHDAPYHVILVSNNSLLPAAEHLIESSNECYNESGKSNARIVKVAEDLIDAEFRNFSVVNLLKRGSTTDASSSEHMFIINFSQPIIKVLDLELSELCANKDLDILAMRKKIEPATKDILLSLRPLIRHWIIDFLKNVSVWQQLGIKTKNLIKFLDFNNVESHQLIAQLQAQVGFILDPINSNELGMKCIKEFQDVYQHLVYGENADAEQFRQALQQTPRAWFLQYLDYREKLFKLAKEGNAKELRELLENARIQYTDVVDFIDNDGMTPFHWAVTNKHVDTANVLLDYGADVNRMIGKTQNKSNKFGVYPLHIAAKNSEKEMVKLLLRRGANAYVYDQEKFAPVDYSIMQGDVEIIAEFTKKAAVGVRHFRYLESKNKVHPKSREFLNEYISFRKKVFDYYWDCSVDRFKILKTLVAESNNRFPLHSLIDSDFSPKTEVDDYDYELEHNCHTQIAELIRNEEELLFLLQQESYDVDAVNGDGQTLLTKLLDKTSIDQIPIGVLIKVGADVNLPNKNNEKPIDIALKHGHAWAVRLLLEKGAVLCQRTALTSFVLRMKAKQAKDDTEFFSWDENTISLFKLLVEHGCNLNTPLRMKDDPSSFSDSGFSVRTPWSLIRKSDILVNYWGYSSIVGVWQAPVAIRQYCIEQGANPNQPDAKGRPELFTAVEKNWLDYARLLIERGHYLDDIDEEGNTAFHIAVQLGRHDMVKLLLEKGAPMLPDAKTRTPLQLAMFNSDIATAKIFDPNATLATGSAHFKSDVDTKANEAVDALEPRGCTF